MRKAKYLTFALALAGALSACGGGGGGGGDKGIKPSGAGLDVTEFFWALGKIQYRHAIKNRLRGQAVSIIPTVLVS
jgi:hypothetical protein